MRALPLLALLLVARSTEAQAPGQASGAREGISPGGFWTEALRAGQPPSTDREPAAPPAPTDPVPPGLPVAPALPTAAASASPVGATALASPVGESALAVQRPRPPTRARDAAERAELERRLRAVDETLKARKQNLTRALRFLYRLSQGAVDGGPRLGLTSASPADQLRWKLGETLVRRAAREVAGYQLERSALASELERQTRELGQAAPSDALTSADSPVRAAEPGPHPAAARLHPPSPGPVVGRMGRYVDARSKTQQVRRGVEIQVGRGLPIHASGGGQVVYIGETPGLGLVVAVEHDENLMTFVGRLAELRVGLGDGVDEDTVLGRSAETTVYFEVRIRGLAVDPLRWVANYASAAKPVAP